MNSLYQRYKKEVAPALIKDLKLPGAMAAPRLVKIVVNVGLGEALKDKKVLASASEQLKAITGQKPTEARAKRAIATFKLRAGDPIGLKVTLRGERMYDFLVRLVSIALPRVRDFRGIPPSGFDGRGNYTLGISEQTIFPELEYRLVDKVRGMEVTFVTNSALDAHAKSLLERMGLPFQKGEAKKKS